MVAGEDIGNPVHNISYLKEPYGVCRNNNHVTGKWVYNFGYTDADKSFYCCSWDKSDFVYNTKLCGIGSMQSWHPYFAARPDGLNQAGGDSCTCDNKDGYESRFKMHKRERYDWTPSFCHLLSWNATQFCELLGDRIILIRGDSTGMQSAVSLMNLIYAHDGGCQTQIIASSAALLGARNTGNTMLIHEAVRASNASIVILSAGAHFHTLADLSIQWDLVPQELEIVRREYPGVKIAFKSINPGHVDCKQHTEPIDTFFPNPDPAADKYHWNMHPAFDNFNRQRALQHNMTLIEMTPLYLRPDMHSDCLHACLPGPVNLFAILVLNMLYTGEL